MTEKEVYDWRSIVAANLADYPIGVVADKIELATWFEVRYALIKVPNGAAKDSDARIAFDCHHLPRLVRRFNSVSVNVDEPHEWQRTGVGLFRKTPAFELVQENRVSQNVTVRMNNQLARVKKWHRAALARADKLTPDEVKFLNRVMEVLDGEMKGAVDFASALTDRAISRALEDLRHFGPGSD